MNEIEAAVCSECKFEISGKIYEGYICSNCKIQGLEREIKQLRLDCQELTERSDRLWNEKNESSRLYWKFKNAFEALVETIRK